MAKELIPIFLVAIYIIGVYVASIIYGMFSQCDNFDDDASFWVFLWPLSVVMAVGVVSWSAILWIADKVPNCICKFVTGILFCLSLPFRPFRIGRIIRKTIGFSISFCRGKRVKKGPHYGK